MDKDNYRDLSYEEKMSLYERAMELRSEKNWSPRKIAEEIGINESTIRGWIYQGTKPIGKMPLEKKKKGDFGKEREDWLDLVDFAIWQILRILKENRSVGVREFFEMGFVGSANTLQDRLEKMESWVLIDMEEETKWPLRNLYRMTDRGAEILEHFDGIGKVVKEIREEMEG